MSFPRLANWRASGAAEPGRTDQASVMLFYSFNGRNVRRTCRHFGISRQTFYRWKRRFDRHDLTTLEERSHRPRQVRRPRGLLNLAERVLSAKQAVPALGKDKLVVLLRREKVTASTRWWGASWRI